MSCMRVNTSTAMLGSCTARDEILANTCGISLVTMGAELKTLSRPALSRLSTESRALMRSDVMVLTMADVMDRAVRRAYISARDLLED